MIAMFTVIQTLHHVEMSVESGWITQTHQKKIAYLYKLGQDQNGSVSAIIMSIYLVFAKFNIIKLLTKVGLLCCR